MRRLFSSPRAGRSDADKTWTSVLPINLFSFVQGGERVSGRIFELSLSMYRFMALVILGYILFIGIRTLVDRVTRGDGDHSPPHEAGGRSKGILRSKVILGL